MYKRPIYSVVAKRLGEPRRFIQVLAGPRQTGKTTLARQLLSDFKGPGHYATADEPVLKNRLWIEQQWETARFGARKEGRRSPGLLVLDEVQKIPGWSETLPAALRLSVLRVAGATGRGQPMGVFQGNPAGQGLARACQGLGVLLSSSRNAGRAWRGHAEMFFSTGYRCSPG